MIVLIAMQLIYTIVCIYFLIKKLDTTVSMTRQVLYVIFSFVILTSAFLLPLIVNYYDSLTGSFVLYLGLYFVTMALLFPDEFIKDKKRTTTMKLSNYILYYYIAVYLPIVALNISNTLNGFQVVGKTLLIVIIVLVIVIGLRFLERKIRDTVNEKTISTIAVITLLGIFALVSNQISNVDLSAYETRKTNEVSFDDESYIAEEYSFYIRELGTEIFDFAIDDEYIYLLTSNELVDTLFVSIIDKENLRVEKSYEFYPENDKYTWFIHLEQDFIFNQNGTTYFTFIDGIYSISITEAKKISDIGDQDSYKFIHDDDFHLAVKEDSDINIYEFTPTSLNLVDSFEDSVVGFELASTNNYLTIKDTTEGIITVYPDSVYTIPSDMTAYPILSANDDEIILSNDMNPLILEFGEQYAKFDYYFLNDEGLEKHLKVNEYMFELRQFSDGENIIVYEVFPSPELYNYDFEEFSVSNKFIHNMFGTSNYSLKNVLVSKNDSLYGIYYKVGDFTSNQIYIEINEVKILSKTFELGYFTDFSKDAYIGVMLVSIAYAGNFALKKKGDWIPKHR